MLIQCKEVSNRLGLKINMHVAKGDRETEQMMLRYGKRSIPFLDEIGYLDENLIAIHLTEATEEETIKFLNEHFIVLKNGFSSENVKKNNRKRIALAIDTLSHLKKTEQEQIFSYIGDYCPNLKNSNDSFEIGNEDDLKMLLWGIEQRFYTTPIKKEKRVANSIITLK